MTDSNATFGVLLGPTDPWPTLAARAQRIEALGFDKLWLPDHFVSPGAPGLDWFECWTLLAALASVTHTVRLGTLVSSMTLRSPALLARAALTLDHLSNGRLEVGVGAGGAPTCHTMTGVPLWDRRERSARFREFVAVIDQMLEQEVTTYAGHYYRVQGAEMHPRPVQKPHPPLSIAAHGMQSLRLVARHGDAWNSYHASSDLTPEQTSALTRKRSQLLTELAAEAGRDPEAIGRTFLFGWTSDRPLASRAALVDTVGRYRDAGIRDFVFMYGAPRTPAWEGKGMTGDEQLERLAEDLRAVQGR